MLKYWSILEKGVGDLKGVSSINTRRIVMAFINEELTDEQMKELSKLGAEPTEDQIKPYLPWSDQLPDYCKNQSKI